MKSRRINSGFYIHQFSLVWFSFSYLCEFPLSLAILLLREVRYMILLLWLSHFAYARFALFLLPSAQLRIFYHLRLSTSQNTVSDCGQIGKILELSAQLSTRQECHQRLTGFSAHIQFSASCPQGHNHVPIVLILPPFLSRQNRRGVFRFRIGACLCRCLLRVRPSAFPSKSLRVVVCDITHTAREFISYVSAVTHDVRRFQPLYCLIHTGKPDTTGVFIALHAYCAHRNYTARLYAVKAEIEAPFIRPLQRERYTFHICMASGISR